MYCHDIGSNYVISKNVITELFDIWATVRISLILSLRQKLIFCLDILNQWYIGDSMVRVNAEIIFFAVS